MGPRFAKIARMLVIGLAVLRCFGIALDGVGQKVFDGSNSGPLTVALTRVRGVFDAHHSTQQRHVGP